MAIVVFQRIRNSFDELGTRVFNTVMSMWVSTHWVTSLTEWSSSKFTEILLFHCVITVK